MARGRKKNEQLEIIETKEKVQETVNLENIKTDLTAYIDEQIKKGFTEELERSNKRLIREKNKKIFWKNIIIILLIALVGFLLYLLNSVGYFNHFFNKNNTNTDNPIKEVEKQNEEKPQEEVKEEPKVTLEDLKKEYGYLINSYHISDKSIYLDDYYNGNLTEDLKKYLTLNAIDFSTIKQEDDTNIINDNTFEVVYKKMFDDNYNNSSFDYNGNKIRYMSTLNLYISSELLKKDNNIQREIINIEVKDNEVIIETVEYQIINNSLYNVFEKYVAEYQENELLTYKNDLNHVIYTFKDNKLVKLGK